jgi:hypothetical protein
MAPSNSVAVPFQGPVAARFATTRSRESR